MNRSDQVFRPRSAALLLTVATILLVASPASRAEDEDLGRSQETGKVENPRTFKKRLPDLEAGVRFCSVWIDADPENAGLEWLPAEEKDCLDESIRAMAKRQFDAEVKRRNSWLAERREEVDKRLGREISHVTTKHFTIAWDIPKLKVGRRVLSSYEAMLLYAKRMEDLHQDILDLLRIRESAKTGNHYYLYMFESEKASRLIEPYVTNRSGNGRSSLYGSRESRHCRRWDKTRQRKDEDLYQSMTYSVTQLIIDHVREKKHWLVKRYGWVHEGMAHVMEQRNHGTPANWSNQEQGDFKDWRHKSWEADIKRYVLSGKVRKFQDLAQKSSEELDAVDHQFAWSYCDYLLWLDPGRFDELLGYMKGPQLPTRDCLKRAYGITMGQFVDGWEQFVRTEYSTKQVKGPRKRAPKDGKGS